MFLTTESGSKESHHTYPFLHGPTARNNDVNIRYVLNKQETCLFGTECRSHTRLVPQACHPYLRWSRWANEVEFILASAVRSMTVTVAQTNVKLVRHLHNQRYLKCLRSERSMIAQSHRSLLSSPPERARCCTLLQDLMRDNNKSMKWTRS